MADAVVGNNTALSRLIGRMTDEPLTLKCPECDAPCFPSASGLWVAGSIELCTGCGARLMVGMRAEVQNLDRLKLREDVAQAWRVSAGVIVQAEDVEVSVERFDGTESQGVVARATVCGINLSEVDDDRGEAMAKLVEAARVRGWMERDR